MSISAFKNTSASQADSFDLCARKWWLEKRLKLPTPDKDYFYYGVALHSIAERWHRADDTGRMEDGSPMELFPEGWDVLRWEDAKFPWDHPPEPFDRDCVVFRYTPAQTAHVRMLVEEAIEYGVWTRKLGRKVEHSFSIPVGATGITAKGFIDLLNLDIPGEEVEIADHKTTKQWRYAKTPEKLREDTQVRLYAKVGLDLARENGINISRVTVRHNIFSKTEPRSKGRFSKIVEAEFSVDEIEEFWEDFVEKTLEMIRVSKIQSHSDIPDPAPGACNAYGGCQFIPICSRQITINKYVRRTLRQNKQRLVALNAEPTTAGGTTPMAGNSPFDRLRKAKGEAEKSPTKPKQAELNPPAPEESKETSDVDPKEWAALAAPWADKTCAVCRASDHPGFNSVGKPCRMCSKTVEARSCSAPGDWTNPEPFKWGDVVKVKEEEQEPEPAAQDKKDDKKATKSVAGRKKKGYWLSLGCFPVKTKGLGKMASLEEIYIETRDKLAEGKGTGFYEIDPFRRKDMLVVAAQVVAESGELDGFFLWGPSKGSSNDYMSFVDALRPGADVILLSVL